MNLRKVIGLAAAAAVLAAYSGSALAEGDAAKGEKVFKKCATCHNIAAGEGNKVGPNLHGIIGRLAGTVEGFNYSDAMKNSGITWTEDELEKYLADPKAIVPGTKMTFPGLKKEDDIENVIAYIKQASQ